MPFFESRTYEIYLFLVMSMLMFRISECGMPIFLRGRPQGGLVPSPLTKPSDDWIVPPDMWFSQLLNHFDASDTRTWKQRYFVNISFHKPDGPVFIMIGGEGKANPLWMVMGQWINYAQRHGALCVMLEHRYYGLSHPTQDLSVDNLKYLSSEQALADLANFRTFIAEKFQLHANKWIAFGGSYPGSLAAWFRMKFPHLVDGAVASSAPFLAKLNFFEYLKVVTTALDEENSTCSAAVANATSQVASLLSTDAGRKQLRTLFKLCDDVDATNKNDVANLFSILAGNFENVVQYNRDNRAFEGAVGTTITISTLCGMMVNNSQRTYAERYAAINDLILRTYGQKCLDFKYDNLLSELRQTNWNASVSEGGRQWMYQTCTEFGYYQSSDYQKQPFGHMFPLGFSVQQCQDIFGPNFTKNLTEVAIRWTNANYGGLGMKISKIVFPNGSTDPWHALGVTSDLSPDATAIFIKDTAHCANMYPDSSDDYPQLRDARNDICHLIGHWLSG